MSDIANNFVVQSPFNFDINLRPTISLPDYVMKDFLSDENRLQPAVVDGVSGLKYTFQDLYSLTQSFAITLRKLGIGPNDCVAIMSPNHVNYFVAFHAVALSGAFSTMLNPQYTVDEMKYVFQITKPKVLIYHSSLHDRVSAAASILGKVNLISIDKNEGIIPDINSLSKVNRHLIGISQKTKVDPNAILTIPFSSGTTGKPKGVILTHQNVVSNCIQIKIMEEVNWKQNNKRNVMLIPLPFYHIYGMNFALCSSISTGAMLVTMPSFELSKFLELIQNYGVHHMHVVPPVVLALAKHPLVAQYDLKSLKSITSGAAPLGKELQMACAKRLNCHVKQGWGMTELSPIGAISRTDPVVPGSSGPIAPGSYAMIADPVTGEILPPTSEGEVLISGPQVMQGYYQNEAATKETIRPDGFLRTGDIGKFDEQGELFITDRCKELIKYKGFQVPPAELEAVIMTMESVTDAIVIPVLDEEAGEVPRAYVIRKEGSTVTEEDIKAYVASKVSPHKKLRGGVRFTDKIPRSLSGKLLRRIQIEIDRAEQRN